jgi:hypothetical protein
MSRPGIEPGPPAREASTLEKRHLDSLFAGYSEPLLGLRWRSARGLYNIKHICGIVSPAYGYFELALVKCSNDGGPGPRHNMKGDPGSSIFSMLVVYYLHLLTYSQNQVTERTSVGPLPPFKPTWGEPPPPPPWGTYSTTCKRWTRGRPRKNHTSASDSRSEAADWARGGCGWAFRRACTRSGSWAVGQRRLTSALLHSAFVYHLRKTRAGRYNQDASMAGRYGAWIFIRDPSVLSYHSAATSRGDHISSHIE